MTRKFGRKPARHTRKTFRSGLVLASHLNALGAPPARSDDWCAAVDRATGGAWGMMANDQFGCCVEADEAHQLMLRTANVGKIVIPTAADVLRLYTAETGFDPAQTDAQGNNPTDQGTDESEACIFMERTGFLGHKARATAALDPNNLMHLEWAIQLFGAVRTGMQVPGYAMDLVDQGKPWDVQSGGDQSVQGGHDVPLVRYDEQFFYAVTWGQIQPVTRAFIRKWFEEAHVSIFDDWIGSAGIAPSRLDMDQLLKDLDEVQN